MIDSSLGSLGLRFVFARAQPDVVTAGIHQCFWLAAIAGAASVPDGRCTDWVSAVTPRHRCRATLEKARTPRLSKEFTMRLGPKHIIAAFAVGATAVAIGVAPTAMADPVSAHPAAVVTGPAPAGVRPAGYHGGGFHGGGYHGGWGGDRGWRRGYGWGQDRQWWGPWGW